MIAKEFRALLPLWGSAAVTMVIAPLLGRDFAPLAAPVFFLGIAAIGAWPIGHEYSLRTLPSLLALPIPRWRIWMTKLAAAVTLLLALSAIAAYTLPFRGLPFGRATYFVPAIAALFVAPWLTMVTRSAVAGIVFSNSIAATLFLAGAWIGVKRYGYTAEVDAFQFAFLLWTMGALTAIAAVHGMWMFLRLQAVDGRGAHIELARTRRSDVTHATAVRRHPVWLLIKKELRLQQLAWIVALIFVAGYVTAFVTRGRTVVFENIVMLTGTIHLLVQSMLTGSLAAAEERAFGTLDGHLLLPMSSARQWGLKSAAAIGHALLLSLALPALLIMLMPPPVQPRQLADGAEFVATMAVLSVVLTSIALYVSSLSSSGVRALMIAIPVVLGLASFMQRGMRGLTWALYSTVFGSDYPSWAVSRFAGRTVFLLIACLLAWLVLWRALPHYRWGGHAKSRITADTAWFVLAVLGLFTLGRVLGV